MVYKKKVLCQTCSVVMRNDRGSHLGRPQHGLFEPRRGFEAVNCKVSSCVVFMHGDLRCTLQEHTPHLLHGAASKLNLEPAARAANPS